MSYKVQKLEATMDCALSQDLELLRELTAEIVAAYIGNNHTSREDLPKLIALVRETLKSAGTADPSADPAEAEPVAAVPIGKSVTPDYIVCLEDGKQFKSLKRHLAARYGLTPDDYRQKWGLANDYPMVAASYAAKRSELAFKLGPGRKAGSRKSNHNEK